MKRLLGCLLCTFIWIHSSATAQPVVFNDDNLKAAVESALGTLDPNASDLLGLTNLYAQGSGISDLTGLEYATNLNTLHLYNNQIVDISPLSELTNLKDLVLYNNQIIDITPLSDMTSLSGLFLSYNFISDFSILSDLMNLRYLDLSGNQINDVSVLSGLTNLTSLSLEDTQVSDISVLSGLTKLEILNLNRNQISDISSLSGFTALIYLTIYNNQIVDISILSGLTKLKELYLGNNPLGDISSLADLTNLQVLDLAGAQISDISFLPELPGLLNLFLQNNQISDVSVLSGLTKLAVLYLTNNQITDVSALSGLTNLFDLSLSRNQINDISVLSGLTNLEWLSLNNNQINDISALTSHTTLRRLYITSNPLCREACTIDIPQIIAHNPDIDIQYDDCVVCVSFYVDDDAPLDPGPSDLSVSDPNENGSVDHPFDSMQEAIETADDHDTIQVAPGRYYETINLMGKSLHLNGLDPNTAIINDLPVIDANGLGTLITFDKGEDPNCIVTGFVLTGGLGKLAGAIACIDSSPVIEHCLIIGNRFTDPNGGAVYLQDSDSVFTNCTIADNVGLSGGAGVTIVDSNTLLTNSTLWSNVPEAVLSLGQSIINVTYSTIMNSWPGEGNFNNDPQFIAPGFWVDGYDESNSVFIAGDYHVMSEAGRWDPLTDTWVIDEVTSPTIDAGNPTGNWSKEPVPNGELINQGAYGGTSQASKSQNKPNPQSKESQ